MLERALLAAALVILVVTLAALVRARTRRRIDALTLTPVLEPLGARLPATGAGIVYFYGPHCSTCRRQAGELDALEEAEQIPIVRVDASREPGLADGLGVLTVPATVLVDRSKRVRSVNLGFRSADVLRVQLTSAARDV
jgi:thiol-disulfide isomerase/thioredoxin